MQGAQCRPTLQSMARKDRAIELVEAQILPPAVLAACIECIRERRNVVVTGPVSAGKTTLLRALAGLLPATDDVLVIDSLGRLQLDGPGRRRVGWQPTAPPTPALPSFRSAVRRALRTVPRPQRLVADEVAGPVAADLLQALDNGCDGSLIAIHGTGIEPAMRWLAECVRRGSVETSRPSVARRVGGRHRLRHAYRS